MPEASRAGVTDRSRGGSCRRMRRRLPVLFASLAMATLTACAGLGPTAVRREQADYADALSEASKQQLLLNTVKLRYLDAPALIYVSQLVAGYSRSGWFNTGCRSE